jgi:hypothetical protein
MQKKKVVVSEEAREKMRQAQVRRWAKHNAKTQAAAVTEPADRVFRAMAVAGSDGIITGTDPGGFHPQKFGFADSGLAPSGGSALDVVFSDNAEAIMTLCGVLSDHEKKKIAGRLLGF